MPRWRRFDFLPVAAQPFGHMLCKKLINGPNPTEHKSVAQAYDAAQGKRNQRAAAVGQDAAPEYGTGSRRASMMERLSYGAMPRSAV